MRITGEEKLDVFFCSRYNYHSFLLALRARFGTSIIVIQLFKMAFGIMAPGKPLAMMYFVAFSQGLTDQAINQLGFLKIGQYLKIPPRCVSESSSCHLHLSKTITPPCYRILFFTQAYGMIVATVTEQGKQNAASLKAGFCRFTS